jgi:hypothetical protein
MRVGFAGRGARARGQAALQGHLLGALVLDPPLAPSPAHGHAAVRTSR